MLGFSKNNTDFSINRLQIKFRRIPSTNLVVNRRKIWLFTILLVRCRLWFSFIVYSCYIIGRDNNASPNYSVKRRLLLCIAFLINFLHGFTCWKKGKMQLFSGSPSILGKAQDSTSALFRFVCYILHQSVHVFSKTPNARNSIVFIRYWDKMSNWGYYLH